MLLIVNDCPFRLDGKDQSVTAISKKNVVKSSEFHYKNRYSFNPGLHWKLDLISIYHAQATLCILVPRGVTVIHAKCTLLNEKSTNQPKCAIKHDDAWQTSMQAFDDIPYWDKRYESFGLFGGGTHSALIDQCILGSFHWWVLTFDFQFDCIKRSDTTIYDRVEHFLKNCNCSYHKKSKRFREKDRQSVGLNQSSISSSSKTQNCKLDKMLWFSVKFDHLGMHNRYMDKGMFIWMNVFYGIITTNRTLISGCGNTHIFEYKIDVIRSWNALIALKKRFNWYNKTRKIVTQYVETVSNSMDIKWIGILFKFVDLMDIEYDVSTQENDYYNWDIDWTSIEQIDSIPVAVDGAVFDRKQTCNKWNSVRVKKKWQKKKFAMKEESQWILMDW